MRGRFAAVALLLANAAAAQEPPAPAGDGRAAASITLATIDPGEVYWQRFGHNALIAGDPDGGEAISYNFGYFDFEQPDFLRRFLLGRMLYQALAFPSVRDLAGYAEEGRSVHLQRLNLDAAQADRLIGLLDRAVLPENRDYLYEYFRANCSTRIRDAIDAAFGGEVKRQTAGRSRGYTYRMHALRLAEGNFWLATGIDLGLGPDTDRPISFWEEMFIPELLRRHLREVRTAGGEPVIAGERTWFDSGAQPPPELARDRTLPFALVGLALAALLLWLSARPDRRRSMAWFAAVLHVVFGLGGAVLLFLWLGTDHVAAHRNENLLLLSPLSLAMAFAWVRAAFGKRAAGVASALAWLIAASATLALLGKTLPAFFVQKNLHWCLLLIPVHLALLVAWTRRRS